MFDAKLGLLLLLLLRDDSQQTTTEKGHSKDPRPPHTCTSVVSLPGGNPTKNRRAVV